MDPDKPIAETLAREHAVAEAVRAACADVAQTAYRDAAMRGLCSDGAMAVATGAIEALDLTRVVEKAVATAEQTCARSSNTRQS